MKHSPETTIALSLVTLSLLTLLFAPLCSGMLMPYMTALTCILATQLDAEQFAYCQNNADRVLSLTVCFLVMAICIAGLVGLRRWAAWAEAPTEKPND